MKLGFEIVEKIFNNGDNSKALGDLVESASTRKRENRALPRTNLGPGWLPLNGKIPTDADQRMGGPNSGFFWKKGVNMAIDNLKSLPVHVAFRIINLTDPNLSGPEREAATSGIVCNVRETRSLLPEERERIVEGVRRLSDSCGGRRVVRFQTYFEGTVCRR